MLTREDLIVRMRRYLGKEVCISPGLRGDIELCVEALAALSPPVTADGEMPGEPHVIREARTLHAEGNVIGLEKRLVIAYEELRTFALREHQGRRAAEEAVAASTERFNAVTAYNREANDARLAAESRAADLERAHADCRKMLEGEHDAHMECHARAEKAEGDARRYRWLREQQPAMGQPAVDDGDCVLVFRWPVTVLAVANLDAAIDALTAPKAGTEGD